MSRSASLSINLTLVNLRLNNLKPKYDFQIVELTQQVENEFIGSPCGQLDQIMIFFAKDGMGTHFNPKTKKITYVPLGRTEDAENLRIVGLDTGTTRHGLESSTYSVRSRVSAVWVCASVRLCASASLALWRSARVPWCVASQPPLRVSCSDRW
jgi:galactokinase